MPAGTGAPPWWFLASIVAGVCGVGLLILRMALRGGAGRGGEAPCRRCGRVLLPAWERCMFCGTAVATEAPALQFVSGPMNGQTVPIDRDVTTIGSVTGNTVLLTDTGVSRKHVGIRRVEGGFELADLGSTNGVFVNGEKVARHRLTVGDVIRVGTTEIVFRC